MDNKLTYELLLENIKNRVPFSFTRFGDGEWSCMLNSKDANGNIRGNCDGHMYFDTLGKSLRDVVKSKPNYYLGMQSLAMNIMGETITGFLNKEGISDIDWSNADILHRASIRGELKSFFEAIETTDNVVLVAPEYMQGMINVTKIDRHVVVPEKNCWNDYNTINYATSKMINRMRQQGNLVVLFCCGMPANVLIDDMYNQYGQEVTLIDVGSLLDPYVGRHTRTYHKNLKI